jgi:NAD(P)H-quinone oxidoreductase subunit 5
MLQLLMLLLVLVVGGVSMRFAWHYLAGAPTQRAYARWFAATILAAIGVVLSPNIILMAAAWTATSLTLHRLLSLDQTRVAAQLAAHKKFLLSRLADVAIWSAAIILTIEFGTANRSEIIARAADLPGLSAATHLALAALAVGVILRSAQLPFHGWLVQVMDVPTPVSALLHAGIVNLGAFVLISLAPLAGRAPVAQGLLLLSGTVSAILAALVMRTRANVKGALAWSTVAQMGFVLVECGLGAYDFAMLHVLAHGLYKSHAFLRSGRVVAHTTPTTVTPLSVGTGLVAGLVVSMAGVVAFWPALPTTPPGWFALVLVVSSVTWLFAETPHRGWRSLLALLGIGLAIPALYALWHQLFSAITPPVTVNLPTVVFVTVISAFIWLAALMLVVRIAPDASAVRWLYTHASCGFHLDEYFTRLTFALWPPARAPRPAVFQGRAISTPVRRAA